MCWLTFAIYVRKFPSSFIRFIAQNSFFESLLPCACDAYANYLGTHYAVVLDMCD